MSYPNYLRGGIGSGVIGGIISWQYYKGKENPVNKKLTQTDKENLVIYLAQGICPTSIPKSTASLIGGPFIGALAGTGVYTLKNFRACIRPAQGLTWLIALTAITALSIRNISNHD